MPIVGCFVFPHGAITLDPDTRNFDGIPAVKPTSKAECIKLHEAMKTNADSMVDAQPDLIILSTPHGLKLQDNFLFLGNSKVKGDAQWDGEWSEFTAECNVDSENSKSLMTFLKDTGNSVELLSIGDPINDPLPLRWGEVIPLWFINNAAKEKSFQLPPMVYIGQPRHAQAMKIIPELLKLGENIFQWIESNESFSRKRIAIVISSDLSHYHSEDPTSPYPFSPFASVFDSYISEWASIDIDSSTEPKSYEKLVTMAGGLVNKVGSCGYTGLVTLYGILKKSCENGLTYRAKMSYYSAPTYYGMMVNNFIPSIRNSS